MHQAFCVCLTTPTQSTFSGLCLQVFRQAGLPQQVNCLILWKIGFAFARRIDDTKRRIASSGIEPGASNILLFDVLLSSIAASTNYSSREPLQVVLHRKEYLIH